MTEALLVLGSLLLVVACGAFVAAEFAFITVDRPSVERAAAGGDRRARGVLAALRTLSTQLSGAQLGITVTNLAIGFLAEPAVARLIDGPVTAVGVPEGATNAVSVTVALVLATAVTMVFGELVPKNLAISRPMATARRVQGFQRVFTRTVSLVIRFLNGSANVILRWVNVEPQEELASARSPEELFSLVGRSAASGMLPAGTASLVQRSLLFGDRTAEDVMTPRVRMRTLGADEPVSAVIALTRRTGLSRFPVVGEDSDDVAGLVHVKHAVSVPVDDRETVRISDVMAPPVVVPSSLPLDPLMETLRAGGLQMAIVVDEFGGTDGLVTVEDLIEEIVGEVVDEHDRVNTVAQRGRDGSWLLSGLLRPSEARETTGVEVPDTGEYQTLGGLMGHVLGRIPRAGDAVEVSGIRYVVERMDGRRVDRIRIEPPRKAAPRPRTSPEDDSKADPKDDDPQDKDQNQDKADADARGADGDGGNGTDSDSGDGDGDGDGRKGAKAESRTSTKTGAKTGAKTGRRTQETVGSQPRTVDR